MRMDSHNELFACGAFGWLLKESESSGARAVYICTASNDILSDFCTGRTNAGHAVP